MFVSQPLEASPSQSAKPELQLPMVHLPLLQIAVALAIEHLVPQASQLDASVFRFASQPLSNRASQLPKPATQVAEHILLAQVGTAFAGAHAFPQPPQFNRLLEVSISQPVDARLSQLPKPGEQTIEHSPLVHPPVPFVELQKTPHVPQFEGSLVSAASQPSGALPLQSAKPEEQVPTLQVELPQVPSEALLKEQELRQFQQLSASAVMLVSHPFFGSPSQLPYPCEQAISQTPFAHEAMPRVLLHTTPQPPQFELSDSLLTSHPSLLFRLQSR